jgi:hypothetical protein
MSDGKTDLGKLIWWPALITLAITALRVTGERLGWSKALFDPAAGGGAALVGISWLPPVFGVYFAWTLVRRGLEPASAWRAAGFAALALLVNVAGVALVFALKLGQLAAIAALAVFAALSIPVAFAGWRELARVLLAYALAARIPVALLMLVAIYGAWGTHYDVAPPRGLYVDAMHPFVKWLWIGLLPQLTVWISFTVVMGMLFATLAVALLKPKPA